MTRIKISPTSTTFLFTGKGRGENLVACATASITNIRATVLLVSARIL